MSFWCLHFPSKNERKQVDLRYHSSKIELVHLFFGGIEDTKICFRYYLTFSGNDSWCGFIQVKVLILLLSYRPKRPLFPRYAFSPIGLEGRHCVQSIRHFELVPTKDQQRAFEWLFHLLQTGKEFCRTFYLLSLVSVSVRSAVKHLQPNLNNLIFTQHWRSKWKTV